MTTIPTLPFPHTSMLELPPQLRMLQDEQPISRVRTAAGDEAWLVTRYAEVKTLFTDERLGLSHPDPPRAPRISDAPLLGGPIGNYATEQADHARMRRVFAPSFSARRMHALRPHVEALVDGLLGAVAEMTHPVDLHER